jgi:hypothetical protein
MNKYAAIATKVKLFKVRSAELGDPNKLLFVAKLASPLFCGARRNIITIKNILNIIQSKFNIMITKFILQFQKFL